MKSHYLINDLELVQTGASPTKKKKREDGKKNEQTNTWPSSMHSTTLQFSYVLLLITANVYSESEHTTKNKKKNEKKHFHVFVASSFVRKAY